MAIAVHKLQIHWLVMLFGCAVLTACNSESSPSEIAQELPSVTATPSPLPTSTATLVPPTPTATPTATATLIASSTPSGAAEDYLVSRPGYVLIDHLARRQELATLGATQVGEICIADPYPWQWGGEAFEVVELNPIVHFVRGPDNDTIERFYKAMMILSAEDIGMGNEDAALAIIETLINWASANALSSLGRSGPLYTSTVYDVKWLLTPTIAAYSLVSDHPAMSSSDRELVENWLEMLVNTIDQPLTDNNHSYMRYAINMEWGALTGDSERFQAGVTGYLHALRQMRPDGSFPYETARGAMAMHYTSHAISSLALMAEVAAVQGHNLYDLEQNNISLHTAIAFLLDAIDNPEIIVDYAAENDNCSIAEVCGDYRTQYLFLYMGWIESYIARFPNSENGNRITQMLDAGVLKNNRRLDGGRVSMSYPNPLDGGVTKCMYSNISMSN